MEENTPHKSSSEEHPKEESKFKSALKSKKMKGTGEKEEDWHARYLDANDKLLRLYADFDNYRKRTLKEKHQDSVQASASLILSLLPVMDDFERALKHNTSSAEPDPMMEGLTLIFNKFNAILESKGLTAIEALGAPFDTDYHEAILNIPAPSEDMKGKVIDLVEKGYLLNGKVIRFAKVIVGI